MTHPQTRPSLLERLRDTADADAWVRFESAYGDLVLRYCARRGMQASDADDVRQIAFLKLMRSLQGFRYDRGRGRFRDYFYQVVRSAIADRAAGRREAPGDLASTVIEPAEIDEAWRQEWEQFHLQRAWTSLERAVEPRTLEVFRRLLDGASVREAARQFDMAEDAVEKIRQRVRSRLRERIEQQVREEDGDAP
ncbi:MAG: RNA polymerase sigma factor [Phycisphaerales bacterium JB039]